MHLRASSVLRLVVQPGEASVVDGRMNGKTVTLPADGRPGEWTGEQDINVDVRDVKRCGDASASLKGFISRESPSALL